MYNPKIHHRKSTRLKGYDYASIGYYFITINVKDKKEILSRIENGALKLTSIGEVVEEEWLYSAILRENIRLHEYVIMPNHFHALIVTIQPKRGNFIYVYEYSRIKSSSSIYKSSPSTDRSLIVPISR